MCSSENKRKFKQKAQLVIIAAVIIAFVESFIKNQTTMTPIVTIAVAVHIPNTIAKITTTTAATTTITTTKQQQ
ncbi:putative integral membrane protein [Brugia pahangi]